ncbi:CoA pyrophosphatase [Candidimonas nitroreducens]|uniref:CoA pyrophosphatase n=1 Tax=Candidimonas nitroreducens TaxID=683354 RepID=A0A225MXI1_9BURK|nr:CoA pyrophosphatase [Candidimonas nitroreducens]OWT65782.1 CoA pyrophosphatase [Candidimonas nitroreducens]
MSHSTDTPPQARPPRRPSFDPLTQPVVAVADIPPALLPSTLELDFIRLAFGQTVPWQVEPVFADSFGSDFSHFTNTVQAAVFIPLVQRPKGLQVIFTRRASHLHDHAGQISFPGGQVDRLDRDAIAAAIRETHEEIGIAPRYLEPIGTHPVYLTSTRYTMLPVIGLVLPGFSIAPNKTEVAEVFEVPLAVLMNPGAHRLHKAQLPDGNYRYYFSITWQGHFIWGATAALIRNLYHYLAAAQACQAISRP